MNKQFGTARFTTRQFDDADAGCAGVELYRTTDQQHSKVATITFWDATGQYYVQTHNEEDIPLSIVEELISEAKEQIKI